MTFKSTSLTRRNVLAASVASLALGNHVWAQVTAYPTRAITLVVPFQAGGTTDFLSRMVAENLGKQLGQAVVVDNRPGGNTALAQRHVAAAAPDGYTLMVLPSSAMSVPEGQPARYDAAKFTPIGKVVNTLTAFVAHPKHKFRNINELIAYAKAHPGELNYAVSAVGGVDHYAAELFNRRAGVDIRMVPYKGAAGALNDLLSGTIDVRWDGYASSKPHIAAGKLTLLGIAEPNRWSGDPKLPTVAEQGLPGFEIPAFFGIVGPAAMPEPVVAKVNAALNAVIQIPEARQRMYDAGMDPQAGTPEQFKQFLREQARYWDRVIQETGISVGGK
jgi:tripartite-type tricarboxylate transporter receptor subunit TctC